MDYADEYLKAKEKGKTKTAVVEIYSWDEVGEELIGKLMDIQPFSEGKFNTEVNKYIIETNYGLVSTVLGASTDKQIDGKARPGDRVYIKYRGKKDLAGGKQVNLFNVETY